MDSRDEAAQRAAFQAEQLRSGSPAVRAGGFGSRRGKHGRPGAAASVPWIMRKRVLIPLVLLLSFGGTAAGLWWYAPVENSLTGQQEHRGAQLERFMTQLLKPEQPLSVSFGGKEQINVLLVGLDHVPVRKGEFDFRRSDSVLLASTDFQTKQVRMVSIPRDGWVKQLNGRGREVHDKLAHSYTHGQEQNRDDPEAGIRNVADAVERLMQIRADYYVVIQFEGLAALVDELGGLEVDVDKNMNYRDRAGGLHINLKKGVQKLSGEQVVQFARYRRDLTGDIARMGRQQKVIKLILTEIRKPQHIGKAPALLARLHQAVQTNFTLDQLMAFAQKMDEYHDDGIQTMTLQSYGNHEAGFENMSPGAGGMSVQVITSKDVADARDFLTNLSPQPPDPPAGEDAAGADANGSDSST